MTATVAKVTAEFQDLQSSCTPTVPYYDTSAITAPMFACEKESTSLKAAIALDTVHYVFCFRCPPVHMWCALSYTPPARDILDELL